MLQYLQLIPFQQGACEQADSDTTLTTMSMWQHQGAGCVAVWSPVICIPGQQQQPWYTARGTNPSYIAVYSTPCHKLLNDAAPTCNLSQIMIASGSWRCSQRCINMASILDRDCLQPHKLSEMQPKQHQYRIYLKSWLHVLRQAVKDGHDLGVGIKYT